MTRTAATVALLLTTALPVPAGEHKVEGRTFNLPDGYTIERVAGPPMADRPIVADLDEKGRLYVADSSGSNDPVQKQLAERPHRVVRLEDTDGDGRYDRRTVFADRMMFPSGAMWLDGSLYVSAPPSIWKLTDTDDDGVADVRVEWFRGKTLTGCANDLHGPYLGPDGWIYWCKGAFARQTYERPGKPPFSTRAAHIFRARPDGSGIEAVMTGGMDNPVDVVFTPGGDRVFSCTFLQDPEGGRRDGLIHAIYGGLYGKVNNVLDEHKRTGPDLMPVMTHLGPAAPAGLARAESDALGFANDLFACQFNLRKVSRHELVRDGATYKTVDREFLVSPDQDFHPTDVIEDADGSILVVDTGGWYKLCCPTSQVEKPDVLGAIYRIRRKDAPRVADPRGLALDWKSPTLNDLRARLDDPRPVVRRRAINGLGRRGTEAVPMLLGVVKGRGTAEARRNAVWAATRIEGEDARAVARSGLTDIDADVRGVSLHAIGLHRDGKAVPQLKDVFRENDRTGADRRVAAEALGRIGDRTAISTLLDAVSGQGDRILEHSLIYALIEIDDPDETAKGLNSIRPETIRAALIASDQMDGRKIDRERISFLVNSGSPLVRETATWVVGRHPEWGGLLATVLMGQLRNPSLMASERAEVEGQVARYAKTIEIQEALSGIIRDPAAPDFSRLAALRAMAKAGLKEVPDDWIASLTDILDHAPDLVVPAVATIRGLALKPDRAGGVSKRLLGIATRRDTPAATRAQALAAVAGGPGSLSPDLFAMLRGELDPGRPVANRLVAADVLSRAKLDDEQYLALADLVATAGPLEVDRLLSAFEATSDEATGLRLVDALGRSAAMGSLRVDMIRPRLAKYPEEVRRRAEPLYARLNADLGKQKARIDDLLATLPPGDRRRGQAVFNSSKAACLACHAIGYVGGKVGPDLTRISEIRVERDLLEAIVYPSASFVRSYEPLVVATKDGRTLSGLVRKDAPDEIVLVTGADKEERVARDDVDEVRPGTVSVMPAGLDQQISRQELADLLAFLKGTKW